MLKAKGFNKGTAVALTLLAGGIATAMPAFASPEMNLRGRIHMDAGFYDEDKVPMGNGVTNRRARMGISGKIMDDWSYQIEYDFAENGSSANDVKLMYSVGGGRASIGQFKVPMGLNELTSSNSISFIERASSSNIIADSRRIGIGYDRFDGNFGFQSMIYSRAIGNSSGSGNDDPIGIGGRLVFNPINNDGQRVHLGISAAFEDRGDVASASFSDRPEARPDGARLINTGTIGDVKSTFKTGVELAFQSGPFSAEAEYLRADVKRDIGNEPTFNGYHVQASYVLTGESRGYRNGVFRSVSPQGARGAWEVAARYSVADLNDGGFMGGEQENFTLGLNYYANNNIRFMINYIAVDVKDSGAVASGVLVGDDSPNILLLRAQVNW